MIVSFIIVAIDLLLRERIGLGTILDALIVGQCTDLFIGMELIPAQQHPLAGAALLLAGMFVMCASQYLYMSAVLCCGPRDSLLVALGKRVRRVPIGAVNIGILIVVLIAGWALGGPVGIGTLIFALGMGVVMQITFRLLRFEPRDLRHQDILASLHVLVNGRRKHPQI